MDPAEADARELRNLLAEVVKKSASDTMRRRALKMRAGLLLPMELVLRKVPGKSVADKAKFLGVGRQRVHYWLDGETRPNIAMSKRLAKISGYDADAIRGLVPDV